MPDGTVYLDNSATTRVDERVMEAMRRFFLEDYGVATSEFGYSMGIVAREELGKAREDLARFLGASTEELVFTSGDTESSNMALKGVAKALSKKKGKGIITSKIEDFPVLNSARSLERDGFKVTYLGVDCEGFVDIDQLQSAIDGETILALLMAC